MNAYGTGGTAGRVAALMAVAETESVRRAEYNPAFMISCRDTLESLQLRSDGLVELLDLAPVTLLNQQTAHQRPQA